MRLLQTVAFLQTDRKFPISALTQPTVENSDRCVEQDEWIFKKLFLNYLMRSSLNIMCRWIHKLAVEVKLAKI